MRSKEGGTLHQERRRLVAIVSGGDSQDTIRFRFRDSNKRYTDKRGSTVIKIKLSKYITPSLVF